MSMACQRDGFGCFYQEVSSTQQICRFCRERILCTGRHGEQYILELLKDLKSTGNNRQRRDGDNHLLMIREAGNSNQEWS